MSNVIKSPRNTILLIHKTAKKHHFKHNRERVSFFASNRGSIIIETSLIIPIFIFVFAILLHIILIILNQNNISDNLYEDAKRMSKDIFDYQTSDNVEIGYESLLTDDDVIRSKKIYSIPMFAWGRYELKCNQTIYFRRWNGETISDENGEKRIVVYITEKGKVFHTRINCTHLLLSIQKVNFNMVEQFKNKNGKSYGECKICIKDSSNVMNEVYITDYGDCYHIDRKCYGILRMIKEIYIEDIGDRKICSRCGK